MCLLATFCRVLSQACVLAILAMSAVSNSAIANDAAARKPLSEYAMRVWTTRDGLPHNSVNRITQSEEGYLWLATWEGPVRYNGRDFTVFDDIRVTNMPESGALDVSLNAATDEVIVAGPRGGLVTYDGRDWNSYRLGSGYAFDSLVDADQAIWVATGTGVFRVFQDGTQRRYTTAEGLPDNASLRIETIRNPVTEQDEIWVATRAGVAIYIPASDTFKTEASLPKVQIRSMLQLVDQTIVIASDDGLYSRAATASEFKPWPVPVKGPITALSEGIEGCLWVGTFEYGVGRLCGLQQEWLSTDLGLPNSHVLDIFRDRENNIWVGTHGGFAQLRDALFTSFNVRHGLKGAYVRSVNTDRLGRLWVGTNDGVSRLGKDGFTAIETDKRLAALSVLSLVADDHNAMYVGSYTEGVLQLIDDKVTAQLSRSEGLVSNEIRVVMPINGSNIVLVGTPDGLYVTAVKDGQFEILNRYTRADGMASDFVTSLTLDDRGGIWASSTASLTYFKPTDKAFEWQPQAVDLASFTRARNIFAGLQHGNAVWFAADHGVIVFNLEQQSWRWLSRDDGLPFEKVFTINFDADENLWLGGSRGIIRVSADQLSDWLAHRRSSVRTKIFTEADGMTSRQITTGGPASVIDTLGNIWFSSAAGAVRVNPRQFDAHDLRSPAPVIESVYSDTGYIEAGTQLAADNSRISFRYVGLGYHMPEQIEYQVQMEGFDSHWIDREYGLQTEYTALPPGSYTFLVRTRYPGSEWSNATEFSFTKAAYFYQSPWFWFIFIVTIIAVVSGIVHWRIRRLEAMRQHLQAMVKKQTHELEKLALTDALTGLANRRAFDQRLAQEVQKRKRYKSALTIALLDLDFFKEINDKFLHSGGDVILKKVAHLIADSVRDSDLVARWGGEEFAIIFPQSELQSAVSVLERIRQMIADLTFVEVDAGAKVTVSIGVMQATDETNSVAQLLQRADRALYQAKQNGRNCLVVSGED